MRVASRHLESHIQAPALWFVLYLLAFLLFWAATPWLLGMQPPSDNFEQLNWALHPALGYSKHPPLPTLVLWLFERIAPAGIVLTYALGGLQVLTLITLAWFTGRRSLDERRALLGALVITCISYYTLRLHYYNHNTALMCATAASMLCTWQAVHMRGYRWWVALGICWAAGLMSKYQMALGIACNVAFVASQMRSRSAPRCLYGLCISACIAALLCVPHLIWLIQHHFPSFAYAGAQLGAALSLAGRADSLLRFFASQTLRLLPAMVVLAIWRWLGSRQMSSGDEGPALTVTPNAATARQFWTIHAWGPFLLMAAMTVFGGVDLEMHWGTAYLWALPLWYLSLADGERATRLSVQDAFAVLAIVQALLMTGKVLFPEA